MPESTLNSAKGFGDHIGIDADTQITCVETQSRGE